MKKFFKLFVTAALAAAMAASFISCGDNGNKINSACSSGWEVKSYAKASEGATEETQFVCFPVTLGGDTIDEIWLNIGAMKVEEATFTVCRYYLSDYTNYTSTVKNIVVTRAEAEAAKGGWVKLLDDYQQSNRYIKLTVHGGVTLNEVVFVNTKGERMTTDIEVARFFYHDENGNVNGSKYYTKTELSSLKTEDTTPLTVIDEQEKFDELTAAEKAVAPVKNEKKEEESK